MECGDNQRAAPLCFKEISNTQLRYPIGTIAAARNTVCRQDTKRRDPGYRFPHALQNPRISFSSFAIILHSSNPCSMKIHWLQHVPFEGLGCIEPWLAEGCHAVTCTQLWNGALLPPSEGVDGLIVMGGPMGVYDEAVYPWLAAEKAFIKQIIAQNKPVLGICLGAQLIVEVLGAPVTKNWQREIGFFPVRGDESLFPAEFMAFHWHGDTFGIPDGAVHLASSAACESQAFVYKDNVLALQFHLETTEASLLALYENGKDEITAGSFMQTLDEMKPLFPILINANALMAEILERLFGNVTGSVGLAC